LDGDIEPQGSDDEFDFDDDDVDDNDADDVVDSAERPPTVRHGAALPAAIAAAAKDGDDDDGPASAKSLRSISAISPSGIDRSISSRIGSMASSAARTCSSTQA
jgi:hypothetical protein